MKKLGLRAGIIAAVVLVSLALIIPWTAEKRAKGKLDINLGLDLQGGSHLVMEVVTTDALDNECDTVAGRIGQQFRDKGIASTSVVREGHDQVTLAGLPADKSAEIDAIIAEAAAAWKVTTPDATSRTVTMPLSLSSQLQKDAVTSCLNTIRNRIDQFGVSEPEIQIQGGIGNSAANRIVLQLPGVEDPSRVKNIIQAQARLEWKEMTYPPGVAGDRFIAPDTKEGLLAMFGGQLPPDTNAYPEPPDGRSTATGRTSTRWWPLKKISKIQGNDLRNAFPSRDQFNKSAVSFELSPDAGRRFGKITQDNLHKIMAIVLDEKVITAPVIQAVITSKGEITGNFSVEAANDLSLQLRSGALPARINIVEERTVGPSLGRDSIRHGVGAALLGFGLVMLFMLFYYRLSGVNAVLALAINVLILLGAMSMIHATLTLPGIAGLVLTVGMSVDSNVLIFERIREEMGLGKTVKSAIDAGFGRVWWTIVDTHVTTLASAVCLLIFGTGPIKGFAVTLIIGLLASVFTAVFVSRFIYDWVLSGRTKVESLSI